MNQTTKYLILSFFIILLLLGIIFSGMYLGDKMQEMVTTAKNDVIEGIKIRTDQETRIRIATNKAVKENLAQYKESYILSGYIRLKNPKVSITVIKEEIELTFHYSKHYGLDPYRVFALIKQECTYDPLLPPGGAGERGAMQVTPEVFEDFMPVFGYTREDFKDWTKVHRVGIAHLANLHKKYSGDYDKMYIEYNAGLQKNREKLAEYYVKVINKNYRELMTIKELGGLNYGQITTSRNKWQ